MERTGFRNEGRANDASLAITGSNCAKYRKHVLHMSRVDFCRITGAKYANISAFETDRSHNVKYLKYYLILVSEDSWPEFAAYVLNGDMAWPDLDRKSQD